MNDDAPFLSDPSPRLEAAFRAAATRLTGLDFLNPALAVEAVGFAPWGGHWLGVLVTPWFMNLMLAPGDISLWQPLAQGEKRSYAFPAGTYEFIGAFEETAGEYQLCSLFSPVLEFEDHATARCVARLAREALFDPRNAEDSEFPAANLPPDGGPLARLEGTLATTMSKQDFLHGRFLAGDHDDRG
jgi:[NiFe] hydrogenase assembly HybE family chaperone